MGDIVYIRARVIGHAAKDEAYIQPIKQNGEPCEPLGEFCIVESWLADKSEIATAVIRASRRH